ncbi:MAG: hypothetical protein WKF94_10260 [Solirubrobacteraceae bacterium]
MSLDLAVEQFDALDAAPVAVAEAVVAGGEVRRRLVGCRRRASSTPLR